MPPGALACARRTGLDAGCQECTKEQEARGRAYSKAAASLPSPAAERLLHPLQPLCPALSHQPCSRPVLRPQPLALPSLPQVVYDSEAVPSPSVLVDALKSGGFDGALRRAGLAGGANLASLSVAGMSCTACSSAVEAALLALPGVRSAAVSVVLQEARVEYDPALATEVCGLSLFPVLLVFSALLH